MTESDCAAALMAGTYGISKESDVSQDKETDCESDGAYDSHAGDPEQDKPCQPREQRPRLRIGHQ
jgi:hypothetical protein